jgi:release factor glutamine methyltransferase
VSRVDFERDRLVKLDRPVPLQQAIQQAAATLAAAGIDSPRWDAEQLAAHLLGVSRTSLPVVPTIDGERYAALVARRASREPLQHIVGTVGFRYVELAVGPGVFIPRPETEDVAGYAIDAARHLDAPTVVDLCAGSGAIAVSVAHEVPTATVHAVEKDAGALEWLRRNASGHPVTIHHADVADALPELDGTVDVVVSNPPYVAEHELADVPPEVRDHDPLLALVAGPDGLDVIRAVERTAHRLLKAGGVVVVEHSDRQGESAPAVFDDPRWRDVADHRDLAGRPRYLTAAKMSP